MRARIVLSLASAAEASTLAAALGPDNGAHATARAKGSELVIEAEADTIPGLLRTVDDVLGCLRGAGVP